MRDWFTVGGVPQNVHAVEKGLAEIVVVRDVATESRLSKLAAQAAQLETDIYLKKHHRVSFINPCPEVHRRGGSLSPTPLPAHTTLAHPKDGRLLRLLTWVVPANCTEPRDNNSPRPWV